MAITSAFLLVRCAFGFAADFLAGPALFAGLAFLPALRALLGFARHIARRLARVLAIDCAISH